MYISVVKSVAMLNKSETPGSYNGRMEIILPTTYYEFKLLFFFIANLGFDDIYFLKRIVTALSYYTYITWVRGKIPEYQPRCDTKALARYIFFFGISHVVKQYHPLLTSITC